MIQIYEYLSVYDKWIYNMRGYHDREELSFQIVMDLVYWPGCSFSKILLDEHLEGMEWVKERDEMDRYFSYEFNFIGKIRKSGLRSK